LRQGNLVNIPSESYFGIRDTKSSNTKPRATRPCLNIPGVSIGVRGEREDAGEGGGVVSVSSEESSSGLV
jgi:hypothetical protein